MFRTKWCSFLKVKFCHSYNGDTTQNLYSLHELWTADSTVAELRVCKIHSSVLLLPDVTLLLKHYTHNATYGADKDTMTLHVCLIYCTSQPEMKPERNKL